MPNAASAGSVTLNESGLGAKKVMLNSTTQAGAGHLLANGVYTVTYNASADTAAGAWMLQSLGCGSSDIPDFAEGVDDRVNALLVAGNNIDLTYNDGAGTLTIDVETLVSGDIPDNAANTTGNAATASAMQHGGTLATADNIAYTLTDTTLASYANKQEFRFTMPAADCAASPMLTITGSGGALAQKALQSSPGVAIAAAGLKAYGTYSFYYNSNADALVQMGGGGGSTAIEDGNRVAISQAPLNVGDGFDAGKRVPSSWNGKSLSDFWCCLDVADDAVVTTIKLKKKRQVDGVVVDMLNTPATIDIGETDSMTAAAPFTLSATPADYAVATGDRIYPYIETPVGTVCRGLSYGFKLE